MVDSVSSRFTASDISSQTTNTAPDVAVNADGRIATFWTNAGLGLQGRIHDQNESPVTGLLDIDPGGEGSTQDVGVTALPDGDFLATWTVRSDELRDGPNNARQVPAGQVFSSDGTPQTDTFALAESEPFIKSDDNIEVVQLGEDRMLATWVSTGNFEEDEKVIGRLLTADGTPIDAPYTIQAERDGSAVSDVDAAALERGGAVLVWHDNRRDKDDVDDFNAIRAEIVDGNGQTVRDKFLINETTAGQQTDPAVGALENGGFAVAWQQNPEQSGEPWTVQTKAFTASGNGAGSETEIAAPDNAGTTPTVAGTVDGTYTVAWVNADNTTTDLEACKLSATGDPLSGVKKLANEGVNQVPELEPRSVDGAAVAWQSARETTGADTEIEMALLGDAPTSFFELPAGDQVTALYLGFFGRAADPAGATYWVDQYEADVSNARPAEVAEAMAGEFQFSDEATTIYPFLGDGTPANDEQAVETFVANVYDNLFDRTPETAGLDYWRGEIVDRISSGEDIGDVIVDIIAGAGGEDIATLANKTDVAQTYTAKTPADAFETDAIRSIVAGVDNTKATLDQGLAEVG